MSFNNRRCSHDLSANASKQNLGSPFCQFVPGAQMVMEGSISTGNGKQNLTSISIFWKCYVGNSTDFQTWDLEKMESCFGNGK